MSEYKRSIEIERAQVDSTSGEFRAVVFTNGEASDGHILDMRGGQLADDMPLFVGHFADPIDQLGTLYPDARSESEIVYRGVIETGGEGAMADIRRDLLLKMSNGHVKRMSGRWDAEPEHVRRRSDLAKDHFAYAGDGASPVQRAGSFFEQWRAVEGSIVGLGADPAATMRWAREASSEPVERFWQQHARDAAVTDFERSTETLVAAGLTPLEIVSSIEATYKIERDGGEILSRLGAIEDLIADLGERATAREDPEPRETEREVAASLPAWTLNDLAETLLREGAASESRMRTALDTSLAKATGKVQR